jgi:hypothetical protein
LINIIEGEDWRTPIMAYLCHYYKPNSTNEHIRMQQRARAYQIVNNNQYKASVLGPLLQCFSKTEGQELLSELHTEICGGHIGARALPTKVLRQGFYWSTMINNVAKLVASSKACQKFSHHSKAPAQPLKLIAPSFLLQRWGIDIVDKGITPSPLWQWNTLQNGSRPSSSPT